MSCLTASGTITFSPALKAAGSKAGVTEKFSLTFKGCTATKSGAAIIGAHPHAAGDGIGAVSVGLKKHMGGQLLKILGAGTPTPWTVMWQKLNASSSTVNFSGYSQDAACSGNLGFLFPGSGGTASVSGSFAGIDKGASSSLSLCTNETTSQIDAQMHGTGLAHLTISSGSLQFGNRPPPPWLSQPSGLGILGGVSCASATRCMAVGFFYDGTTFMTRAEHWNGSAWSVSSPVNPPGSNERLVGVSCPSVSDCIAVGGYDNTLGVQHTLVEQWGGTSWSVLSSANLGSLKSNFLFGVSCPLGTSSCTAVGEWFSGKDHTLIETGSLGGAFTTVTSPNPGVGNDALTGVACVSLTFCEAVGSYGDASGHTRSLIETLHNSANYKVTPSPNPSASSNSLVGVTCRSATDCAAVGYTQNSSAVYRTLVATLNSSGNWYVAPSDNHGSGVNALAGVACVPGGACVAVGRYLNGSNVSQTLVLTQSASGLWKATQSANPGPAGANDQLFGTACSSSSVCYGVGVENDTNNGMSTKEGALIEKS